MFAFHAGQGFDDPNPLGILSHDADHAVHRFLNVFIKPHAPKGNEIHHRKNDGKHRQHDEGEKRVHDQRHDNSAEQKQGRPYAQTLDFSDKILNVIGVRRNARFQRRNGKSIYLSPRKSHGTVKEVVTDLLCAVARNLGGHSVCFDVADERN